MALLCMRPPSRRAYDSLSASLRHGEVHAQHGIHVRVGSMARRAMLLQAFLIAMTSLAFGESESEAEKFRTETATSLTETQACLKSNSMLRFPRLEAIDPPAGSIVAVYRHGVEMNALVAIDPPTAEALA